jgi:hypothetical protein
LIFHHVESTWFLSHEPIQFCSFLCNKSSFTNCSLMVLFFLSIWAHHSILKPYLASHTSAIHSISQLTINLMKTKIQWITNLSKLVSCLFLLLLECVFMFCYFYVIVVRRDTRFDWEKSRILQIPKRQVSHTVLSYYFYMHFVVIFSSYSCVGLF